MPSQALVRKPRTFPVFYLVLAVQPPALPGSRVPVHRRIGGAGLAWESRCIRRFHTGPKRFASELDRGHQTRIEQAERHPMVQNVLTPDARTDQRDVGCGAHAG